MWNFNIVILISLVTSVATGFQVVRLNTAKTVLVH